MAKLILTHEVSGLGIAGDVVEVKDGYATNFLVPRKLATPWSAGAEKSIDSMRKARRGRELASVEEAQAARDSLQSNPVDGRGERRRVRPPVRRHHHHGHRGRHRQPRPGGQASHPDRSADQGAGRLPGQGRRCTTASSRPLTSRWLPPLRARFDGPREARFPLRRDGGPGALSCVRLTPARRRDTPRRDTPTISPRGFPHAVHLNMCLVKLGCIDVGGETIHRPIHRKRRTVPNPFSVCPPSSTDVRRRSVCGRSRRFTTVACHTRVAGSPHHLFWGPWRQEWRRCARVS